MPEKHGQFPFNNPALSLQERVKDLISRLTLDEKIGFIPTRNAAVQRLGIEAWSIGAEGAHGFVDREGKNTTFPQTIGLAASWDRDLLKKIGEACATEARVYYETHGRKGGLALWSPTIDMGRDPRWGRTEECYGEDPFLAGELSSCYIQGAQGDDPFYLRVSCGPKHFFANNNEKDRVASSSSVPSRCMNEYYLVPFKTAVQKAKAASMMTAYNEVNGIPMMLHPMLNGIVKKQWGMEGHFVTDGGDFVQTVNDHCYFETHAETLATALKNGGDSMTDSSDIVIAAAKEALEKKLIREADLDPHLERILSVRFRLGHFDPPGACPYDSIINSRPTAKEYADLAREAVGKSAVLLKNEGGMLPIQPGKKTIAVLGPLSNAVHLDWYSGNPEYICTVLDGLRNAFDKNGETGIIHADCRDIVSLATEDGRPLVLLNVEGQKVKQLCVGKTGDTPTRFYMEDWGWGSQTFTDVESGLLLEAPYWRCEPGENIDNVQNRIYAGGKSTLNWFAFSVFSPIPQAEGFTVLRTYDNRRLAASAQAAPVFMRDDPEIQKDELFRINIETSGICAATEAAAKADSVIFIAGNNPMINGRECVDRPSLNLPPWQEECINRVFAANKNLALVLISGYPFTCKNLAEKIPAILWMSPGIQETGNGLAEIIIGHRSPAGRLPLTWYEDESQLPSIMDYDIMSAGTTYQYFCGKTLWPFAYGLSYSGFEYSNLAIDKTQAGKNESVEVCFWVKNTGQMEADEVPQLYVTVSGSVFRRPLQSLKGFKRIPLAAGEEKQVRFELPVSELAVWDPYRECFCIENCRCTVSVGSSSQDIRLSGGFDVLGENLLPRKFSGTKAIHAQCFDDWHNCFLHEKRSSSVPAVFAKPGVPGKATKTWIRFAALDFSNGSNTGHFSAIAQGRPGSRIELRLDAPDGKLAGIIDIPNTAGTCDYDRVGKNSPRRRQIWASAEGQTEKIYGIHDLYIVLHGEAGIWEWKLEAKNENRRKT